MVGTEQRRVRFEYGEDGDEAELVLHPVATWSADGPRLTMVALPGTWQYSERGPDTLTGKQMLRGAETASGLRLAFRAESWRIDGDRAIRELVLVGDNGPRLAAILRDLLANA